MINQYIKRSDVSSVLILGIIWRIQQNGWTKICLGEVVLPLTWAGQEKLQLPSYEGVLDTFMVHLDSILYFIQPKNLEINKEYGRGNRVRKQINYSDEVIDDQVLNITDYYDEDNNNEN